MATTSALLQQQKLQLQRCPTSSLASFPPPAFSPPPAASARRPRLTNLAPNPSSKTLRSSSPSPHDGRLSPSPSPSPSSYSSSSSSSSWSHWRAAVSAPSSRGASAESDVMGLLLRQRIVFLGFNLDEYAADAIISQLLLLDALDPLQDIRLFINSPGGSTNAAMAVYDAIQLCRADVSTIAFGIAASTVAIVLAGGTKGKRFAMPNARIMLHQPLGSASGQVIDVEIQAKEAMHHRRNVTRIISEITGRAIEQVEKDIDRDRYMSPAEAMEYGILDGVIDKDMIIPLCPSPRDVLLQSPGY